MSDQVKVGSWTGDGAAKNVEIGWIPDYVLIINTTDGDIAYEWFNGMGAADAIRHNKIADNGATGAASFELITSGGIDAYAGSTDNKEGFTLAAAANENAKVFRYVALRNL
jgi:hypothetical protein